MQTRWWEGSKPHHWVFLVGVGFMAASPFLALVSGVSGWLAFLVGLLAVFAAAHTAPDNDED